MKKSLRFILACMAVMTLPSISAVAQECCRVQYYRCRPYNENIPCQHCVDGDCSEKAMVYSTYGQCDCEFDDGKDSCMMISKIYCAYEYHCIEVPAGCASPGLKYCDPDYDNPIPYTPYGYGSNDTSAGDICAP